MKNVTKEKDEAMHMYVEWRAHAIIDRKGYPDKIDEDQSISLVYGRLILSKVLEICKRRRRQWLHRHRASSRGNGFRMLSTASRRGVSRSGD